MNTISIFVASPTDLENERKELKALANDLNVKHSKKSGTKVDIISYENLTENKQTCYDDYIKNEADLVLVIFDADKFDRSKGKGGETLGEYDKAIESFKNYKRPEVTVFTHTSNDREKKRKLKSIQDHVRKTSDKYCIDYTNIEDLKNKAKEQIKQFVKRKTSISYKLKLFFRYAIPALAILLIAGIFLLCLSIDNKNHMYIDTSIQPNTLISNKYNHNVVETQISHDINDLEKETKNKLDHLLSRIRMEGSIEFAQMDSLHPTITNELDNIHIEKNKRIPFIKIIRKMLGKHDINADINFTESDSVIICSIKVDDWDDQSHLKKMAALIRDYSDEQACMSALIRKCTAFIAGFYAPIVPVLYDYVQRDELEEYQSNNPWHDEYFVSDAERESFIKETFEKEHPALAYYLQANYYEETGTIEEDNNMLHNAITYYNKVIECDTTYRNELEYKINIIKERTKESKSTATIGNIPKGTGNKTTRSLPEELENNGMIPIGGGQQLIVIKGQEKIIVKDNYYYKATFYTFEKGSDNQWKEVFTPFKVNLGAHGIVSKEQKTEGDLSTPEGYYPIPFVFGYENNINTKMDFREVTKNHVWVCNPKSDKYNTFLIDDTGEYINDEKNEKLLRNDVLNEYAIVVDYNTHPVIKGKGSAIFMHVERATNHRTAGCISMPKESIIKVIQWLDPDKHPHVYIRKKP